MNATVTADERRASALPALVLQDLIALCVGCLGGYGTGLLLGWTGIRSDPLSYAKLYILIVGDCLFFFVFFGLYGRASSASLRRVSLSVLASTVVAWLAFFPLILLILANSPSEETPPIPWIASLVRLLRLSFDAQDFSRFTLMISFVYITILVVAGRYLRMKRTRQREAALVHE